MNLGSLRPFSYSRGVKATQNFWLTRLFYIRGLGILYVIIGGIVAAQGPDLIGPNGLTPVSDLVEKFLSQGQWLALIQKFPSLLFYDSSNLTLYTMAATFLIIGFFMMLGFANSLMLLVLWGLQLSLVNGAGLFWGFGWETMMLEMTLLAVFIVHPWRWNLMSPHSPTPNHLMFLPLLWMLFRLLLGAGLIKIRGDECWLDLTCMESYYQTQPNPHFLSWYYHQLPDFFHQFEVVATHFFELVVPVCFLLPLVFRRLGAFCILFFQLVLFTTGNLAYLTLQTIVLTVVGLDDGVLKKWVGHKTRTQLQALANQKVSVTQTSFSFFVWATVLILSFRPLSNMISPQQRMNQSYDSFHLVNSYGLFGSITKTRYEIVISGTTDATLSEQTQWQEYQFYCKPGDVERRPCWVTPYHLRLDWQMWFSAMRPQIQEPWLVTLAQKMLENDPLVDRQLAYNPFAGGTAPRFIKMDLYRYEFTNRSSSSGAWWQRSYVKPYMPAITLKNFLQKN